MASRRVAPRGRTLLALALLGFVLVAAGVIWRRTAGIRQANVVRALEQQRQQLTAQRAKLEADIRDASSRATLAPIVERRLDMHVPKDSQVVILPRTSSP